MLPYLTVARLVLAVFWISTHANLADYPSRMKPLPPPRAPRGWTNDLLPDLTKAHNYLGIELFAGSARLTTTCRWMGLHMLDPWDLLYGPASDIFSSTLDTLLETSNLYWAWLSPPCSSFSILRNLDPGGPLRPKDNPYGDEAHPHVALGNRLWRRALSLARTLLAAGVHVAIEHPASSHAWRWAETEQLIKGFSLQTVRVDWCMFVDDEAAPRPKKPTLIVTSAPWISSVHRTCSGDHTHGKPLRGGRAKAAAAYPWTYCREVAASLAAVRAADSA